MKLSPLQFTPLPYGVIQPRGWLKNQLRLQAESLSGHLDEFWPDIQNSQWFGGTADGWERAPYWLDGVIPLAFLHEDADFRKKVTGRMESLLERQHPQGWLGPMEGNPAEGSGFVPFSYDLWAELLVFKVMMEYHRATGEERVLDALEKGLRYFDTVIDMHPLANWGQFRWFEGVLAIFYLYDLRPQDWLLDLAVKLQAQGFDWVSFFENWPMREPTPKGRWNYMGHVVNNAMAIKCGPLWARLSQEKRDRKAAENMLEQLDEYHGMPSGVFTGDECLAGRDPTQGTELCAVVEMAYSLENLTSLTGEAAFADRLERVIFNALPATFSPDMWAHQYDQQVNQVLCDVQPRNWNTNGPESNLFGLEPNYGCCTANLSQGWPKYAGNLWMRSRDGGWAACSYAPCQVNLAEEGIEGSIRVDTVYPFEDTVRIIIEVANPCSFPLWLRIPGWCKGARLALGDEMLNVKAGEFLRVEGEWEGATELILTLPAPWELKKGGGGGHVLRRGPLVFSIPVGEKWKQINKDRPHREKPHADYQVNPTSPWNFALVVDEDKRLVELEYISKPVGDLPFSPEGAPIRLRLPVQEVPGWELVNGSSGPLPKPPAYNPTEVRMMDFIPYGCTNLRITEIPLIRQPGMKKGKKK